MAAKKKAKKSKGALKSRKIEIEVPMRRVPKTFEIGPLKLDFKKVVRGVTHASLHVKSGEACIASWEVPSRCLVHGEVELDVAKSVIRADFEGVHILEDRLNR
jgi:hypothetical protein